jgi:hypothetical protein
MFAGDRAIPLEAARLGCETYAVELNPVAHLIELGTLTFLQRYGTTLADDVEKWGRSILSEVCAQVSDLMGRFPKINLSKRNQRNLSYSAEDGKLSETSENLSLLPTIGPEQHHVLSRLVEQRFPYIGRLGCAKKNRVSSHSNRSPTVKRS